MSEVDPITTPTATQAPAAQAVAPEAAANPANAGPIDCKDKKAVMAGLLAKAGLSDRERSILSGSVEAQAQDAVAGFIGNALKIGKVVDLGLGAEKALATKKLFDATEGYECKDAAQEMLNPSPVKGINPLKMFGFGK